jgi:hypothetical protein
MSSLSIAQSDSEHPFFNSIGIINEDSLVEDRVVVLRPAVGEDGGKINAPTFMVPLVGVVMVNGIVNAVNRLLLVLFVKSILLVLSL